MKLEVGKFYTVRDPEGSGISKVRVDCIRPLDVRPRVVYFIKLL